MTKTVRIENADNSTFKVRVRVENLIKGEWVQEKVVELPHPTMLATEYLTGTRRFIVEEYT